MGRDKGVREEQLLELSRYRESEAFTEIERRVIELADLMTRNPAEVPQSVFDGLRKHFDEVQLVELAAAIGWENYRARFNRVFEVAADGFSEGAVCVLPAHAGAASG